MDLLESRLREAEERYRSLCDALPEMVWISDAQGSVTYANERCLRYTGLSTQEKYGDGWVATIHPDDLPLVHKAWVNSIQAGEPFQGEYRIRRHDGEFRWFLGKAVPVARQGRIDYWIGTATDIEVQKRTAEELRSAKELAESASRAKSTFLAHMSHEIRTPLSAILGYATLLKDDNLSAEERGEFVDTIIRNGQGLTRVIDDILDLAKVEAGRLEFESSVFRFEELMRECVSLFAATCQEKNIDISLKCAPEVPPYLRCDATRLRQVMLNIIGNAVKFTTDGGVRVRARLTERLDDVVLVAIEVEDTGCGLSETEVRRLFQPFTQADSTTNRRYGGTGLGLVLSRRLCHAMGGDVTILRAIPDAGCTFQITFTAEVAEEPSAEEQAAEHLPAPGALQGLRVLLAEDTLDNRVLITHLLENYGATVQTAENGSEALEAVASRDFDVVLMDIQMPHLDGYQTLARLRESGCRLPVLALTAHATLEERARTQAAGFLAHLTKPIDPGNLVRTLRAYSTTTTSEALRPNVSG